jgi:hypothetical protein
MLKPYESTLGSDPQAGTDDMDPVYLETVTHHNRQFQQYAIENRIYFAPADEVPINANGQGGPRVS